MSSTSNINQKLFCCNPLKKPGHNYMKKGIRVVSKNLLGKIASLNSGDKLCDCCRKELLASIKQDETKCVAGSDDSDKVETVHKLCSPEKTEALEALNKSLMCLNETPVKKKKLGDRKYSEGKLQRASTAIRSKLLDIDSSPETENAEVAASAMEIIDQLKEEFNSSQDRSRKMQILTTLPKSWSIRRIQTEFGVANYTARKSKSLQKEKGIMSCADPKPGKLLDFVTTEKVISFYECEEVSRIMPGKKDFVSVNVNGKREHIQKNLILCNLRELFSYFKEKYPQVKIGFSKFCELRPKHCVLVGGSGTHSVCVCTTHQNAKLMLVPCKFSELCECSDKPLKTYQDILDSIICENPTEACYFMDCTACPGTINLNQRLEESFELNHVENVTYKQWMQLDKRTVLETLTKPCEEFIATFIDSLPKLLRHSFIAKKQSSFLSHLKENLKENEYLVLCDFAENYSFVLQDAAQGFHWNNAQATIHPFSVYCIDTETKMLRHTSFVVISECLIHDTIAVHLFQRHLINFLKSHFPTPPAHMYYFSDGAGSQYKNKLNFLNLCLHEQDFGIKAEWHFFATSHGKSTCDGIGGTVKRLAARESLHKVFNDQIMTPRQLFDWAKQSISSMHFIYSTTQEHQNEEVLLRDRISSAKVIVGTQKLHSFIPSTKQKVIVKPYSFSETLRMETTTIQEGDIEFSDMVGFVTCKYDEKWWLGCILDSYEDKQEVKVSFLHPNGPSPSYKYPELTDVLCVHKSDILTRVDPLTATGRVYTLTKGETQTATTKLLQKVIHSKPAM